MFKFVLSTAQSLKSVIPAVINGRSISVRPLLHMASEAKVSAMPTTQFMRDFGSTPTLMRSLTAPVISIRNTHTTALKLNESTLDPIKNEKKFSKPNHISEEFIDQYLPYLAWNIQINLENDDERISFARYVDGKYGSYTPTLTQLKEVLLSDLRRANDQDYAKMVSEMQTQCIELDRDFTLIKPIIIKLGDFLENYYEDQYQQVMATKSPTEDSPQIKSGLAKQLNIAIHAAKTEWELVDILSNSILLRDLRYMTPYFWISYIERRIINNLAFFSDPTFSKEHVSILLLDAEKLSPSFNFPNDLIERYVACLEKDISIDPTIRDWMSWDLKKTTTPTTQHIKKAIEHKLSHFLFNGGFKEAIVQMEKIIESTQESTNTPRAN